MRPPNGGRLHAPSPVSTAICGRAGAGVRCTLAVALAKTAATDHAIRKCAFSPNCWGTGGVEGWGGNGYLLEAQYQTHMQAPTYDVHFLRSEALRSSSSSSSCSSSSSSRTRQIKECKIIIMSTFVTRNLNSPQMRRWYITLAYSCRRLTVCHCMGLQYKLLI